MVNAPYQFYVEPTDGRFWRLEVPPGDEPNRGMPRVPATHAMGAMVRERALIKPRHDLLVLAHSR